MTGGKSVFTPLASVHTNESTSLPNGTDDDIESLRQKINETALVQKLTNDPDNWKEYPYAYALSDDAQKQHLVHNALRGHQKLAELPRTFLSKDKQTVVAIVHLGHQLCGHKGIIHGGAIATLFDELLARPAMIHLPRNTGFTASLTIHYRRPVKADQLVVVRSFVQRSEGRKIWVNGVMEDLEGNVLSEAESLFVSPRDTSILPTRSPFSNEISERNVIRQEI